MADDEQLREALLELQVLRDSETRAHAETAAALGAIERFARAPTPEAALEALFGSLAEHTAAERVWVVEPAGAGDIRVLHALDASCVGLVLHPPVDLFERPRNVTHIGRARGWRAVALGTEAGTLPDRTEGSLICAPLTPETGALRRALLCLSGRSAAFSRFEFRLVQRVSGLAAQALESGRLAAENALLAAAIEGSSAGFSISDATRPDEPVIYVNPAFERVTGWAARDVIGRNCRMLSGEPSDAPERVRLRETVARRGEGRFLLRNRRACGETFWNELTLFPVRDESGAVSHLVATQSDVTDRVVAERERDRLRQRIAYALSITEDGFLLIDARGEVLLSNDALGRAFPAPGLEWAVGTSYAENRAAHCAALPSQPGVGVLPDAFDLRALAEGGHGINLSLANGKSFLLRARQDEAGLLVLTATNITRLKTAEALLQQRAAAIDAAFDGIAVLNDDQRLVYLNQAAATLFGVDEPVQALGRDWRRGYMPEPRADAGSQTACRPGPDGLTRTHEITRSALASGGSVLIIRDITERLAEESRQEELRAALARAQRQEALSQLAAGVAHDFNNLLSAISGSATLIGMDTTSGAAAREHAERILAAGQRAARLVNRLLDLGAEPRGGDSFDLRSALEDLPAMVATALAGGVVLDLDLGAAPLTLEGDAGVLNQCCLNLVLNAIDALPAEGGRIVVTARTARPDAAREMAAGMVSAGRPYARIEVADTGCGMEADTLARIFEPHFSTKGARGTGLGLTMVALQVKGAGGAIEVESRPGDGTRFALWWPLKPSPAPEDGVASRGADVDLSGLTCLVVDDDCHAGEVVQAYLEARGAEVALCDDPRDAAEALEEDPSAWGALVTDYDMPGLNGGDLAERARATAPGMPVILVTALARRLTDPRVSPERIAALLAKPVDLGGLARLLGALHQSGAEAPEQGKGEGR